MKVAITHENGMIFQHFGHTEEFKIYEVNDGAASEGKLCPAMGFGHGALAGLLKTLDVDVLICGGIGGGAQAALAEAGIKVFGGCEGSCDEAAKAFAEGRLSFDPNIKCSHHDSGEHSCGSHSCSNH